MLMFTRLISVLLFLMPYLVVAQETEKAVAPASGFGGMLAQMLFVLMLVLGLLLAVAWVLRRAGLVQGAANGHLKILGAVSVGSRERVLLIQVGQEQLVIGVTAVEISLLHLLAEPINITEPNVANGAPLTEGFAQKLQSALQRRQKVSHDD
jgi:flagellar protein FliO/FliZ